MRFLVALVERMSGMGRPHIVVVFQLRRHCVKDDCGGGVGIMSISGRVTVGSTYVQSASGG